MAKDRNTMAKRQREADKRHKASQKREKMNRRKTERESTLSATEGLTEGEVRVLAIFKRYLMVPGQMLCLNNADIVSLQLVLEGLVHSGLLVSEDFKGSYSLTQTGYQAMNTLA